MKLNIERTSSTTHKDPPCEGATRVGDAYEWTIELASLEALVALTESVGESIIVHAPIREGDLPSLEIYDYYRE